jgi:Zn-dependent protease
MLERGYWTVFRVRGVPVRLHWTLPIGALLLSGGSFAPGLWLGIVGIILLHEIGHALLVRAVGLVNIGIDLTGFGGQCRFVGDPTPMQRSIVAWGGVLAQLVVLVVAMVALAIFGTPENAFVADLAHACTRANAFLIVLNLIPIRPLDGADAWPLFTHFWRARARRRRWRKGFDKKQTLREAFDEADRD